MSIVTINHVIPPPTFPEYHDTKQVYGYEHETWLENDNMIYILRFQERSGQQGQVQVEAYIKVQQTQVNSSQSLLHLRCGGWTVYSINKLYNADKGGEGLIVRQDGHCGRDHVPEWVYDRYDKGSAPPSSTFIPTTAGICAEIDKWRSWTMSQMML
jgi:hypothetical protein